MNVLSLFDGMSCGQLALERVGIDVDKYYASEIDKYAIAVTQHRFPKTIQLGDVRLVNNIRDIDLLIGGSPCQGFSRAGNKLNFDDPRSALFFEYVRILKECKPKYFLLENVYMKQWCRDIITECLGVKPIMINSALVSAQNRVRLYWTNIPGVDQPDDKGILLKDILDDQFIEKTDRKGDLKRNQLKASCLTGGGNHSDMDMVKVREYLYKNCAERIYKGKAPTIRADRHGLEVSTVGGSNGSNTLKVRKKSKCVRVGGLNSSLGSKQEWDSVVEIIQRARGTNKGGIKAKDGKTPSMTSSSWEHNNHLTKGGTLGRRLSVVECERLQTVPDNYTLVPWKNRMMSNSQRYKMLGNGWTVDIIAHILEGINGKTEFKQD